MARARRSTLLSTVICATLALGVNAASDAGQRKMIRFYKLNDKGQENRQTMIGKTDEEGCHNTRRKLKASRIVVLGFSWCEVYANKDCQVEDRLVPDWDGERAKSENKRSPNGKMDQGGRWLLSATENVQVQSFNCVSE